MSTETMKAWQVTAAEGGIENHLALNDIPSLKLAPLDKDEILVEVISAAINPVDYKALEVPIASKLAVGFPSTPGLDYVGKVVKSGTLIDSVRNGQLVFGRLDKPGKHGTLGELTIASKEGCCPLPQSDAQTTDRARIDQYAALGTAALTAYQCIAPYVKKGDRVFINGGSGGTGSYGIQIARNLGVHVTTSCSSKNADIVRKLGAQEVITYDTADVNTTLREHADKHGQFDLVVDNVGTPSDLYNTSDSFLKESGHFVQVGAEMNMMGVLNIASRTLVPSFLGGGSRPFKFLTTSNKLEDLSQLATWVSEGRLETTVKTFEKTQAKEAFELIKTHRTQGKILVHMQ